MRINGLDFVFDELHRMQAGVCGGCHKPLQPFSERTRQFTCNDACHARWIDALVARVGETRVVTNGVTGRRHVVPTRVILEQGITVDDLSNYPAAEEGH